MYIEEATDTNTPVEKCGSNKYYLKKEVKQGKQAIDMIIYLQQNDYIDLREANRAIGNAYGRVDRAKKDLKQTKQKGK